MAKQKMTDEQKQYKKQWKDAFNMGVSERLIELREKHYGINKATFKRELLEKCTDPETGNSIIGLDSIDNYELGKQEIPGSILMIIADYYTEKTAKDGKCHHVTVDYLLGRGPNPFETDLQKQIEEYTGLSKAAYESLKSLNDKDCYSVALEGLRFQTGLTNKFYNSVSASFFIPFLNFFLERYDLLKKFIYVFQRFALPDQFDVPVRKTENGYEVLKDDICMAADNENLDDNIPIVMDSFTSKAIFKNELDMILNQYAAELYETAPFNGTSKIKNVKRQHNIK